MDLFSFDSPFMSFMTRAVEYMMVSLLCLVFCIPVVTIGAAVTAQYYVGMKLIRGEDVPFFRGYIKSFKENFKQSTIIWLIELAIGAFLAEDWYLIVTVGGENFNMALKILLGVVTLYLILAGIAVFALIARFQMTTREAIKGALVYTYVNIPRMILVLVLTVFPTVASIKYINWLMAIWPIGSATCLYIISFNFAKSFKKLEQRVLGTDSEETDDKKSEEISDDTAEDSASSADN